MKIKAKLLLAAACAAVFLNVLTSSAQTIERPPTNSAVTQSQSSAPNLNLPPVVNPTEVLASEIGQLRKSLQTLTKRLSEISGQLTTTDAKQPSGKQNQILLNLEVLTRAEQRAEALRRQLVDLIWRENQLKSQLVQNEEDARPENIERVTNTVGTTRTVELREVRRRVLENDREGLRNLLNQVQQSRARLETDVQQADLLVSTLRQNVLPIIEKEVQKLNVNQL